MKFFHSLFYYIGTNCKIKFLFVSLDNEIMYFTTIDRVSNFLIPGVRTISKNIYVQKTLCRYR